MRTRADVLHRISCGERAFGYEKRCYCCRDIPLIRRLRHYDGKVRAKLLFGAGGMTSDQNSLIAVHKCEGKLLAKMMWGRKGAGEDWSAVMQRVYLHARRALHSAGLPMVLGQGCLFYRPTDVAVIVVARPCAVSRITTCAGFNFSYSGFPCAKLWVPDDSCDA
eukprot:9478836-Pyramimonas_sp.AAC.1